jgi:uncharacterized hydrophobic protein (TIGR00271 family)
MTAASAPPPARLRLLRLFNLRRNLDRPEEIDAEIRGGVEIKGPNLWILLFAMLIASVGLDVNSTAVIIGAMLISPLMGPIVGFGYALAIGDTDLMRRALVTLGVFTAISLAASTLYFALSPLPVPGSELAARTSPTLWDVLIAFFGGAAGIIGLTRRGVSNVVPGVAIATALMPPLCTAGYSIANGRWDWMAGALYLFAINGVFIGFATLVFVKLMRLRPPAAVAPVSRSMALGLGALTLAAMLLPAGYLAWNAVRAQNYATHVNAAIDAAARLSDVVVLDREIRPETHRVAVTVAGDADPVELRAALATALADAGHADTEVSVRAVGGSAAAAAALRTAWRLDVNAAAGGSLQALRADVEALKAGAAARLDDERELARVADELRALWPRAGTVGVGVAAAPAAAANERTVLVQIGDRPGLATAERTRLAAWLAKRLPGREVVIAFASTKHAGR